MKRKCTVALSPVRRQSLSMLRMVAVCLMLPQCTAKRARGVTIGLSCPVASGQETQE